MVITTPLCQCWCPTVFFEQKIKFLCNKKLVWLLKGYSGLVSETCCMIMFFHLFLAKSFWCTFCLFNADNMVAQILKGTIVSLLGYVNAYPRHRQSWCWPNTPQFQNWWLAAAVFAPGFILHWPDHWGPDDWPDCVSTMALVLLLQCW